MAKASRAASIGISDKVSSIVNGPAGEMGMKSAGIAITDPHGYPNRFAGRGGLGAVMGTKGIKLIAIFEEGLKGKEHADKDAFIAAVRKFSGALTTHAVTSQALPTFGTNVLANIINEAGGYPTRNFLERQFEGCGRHPAARRCGRSPWSAAATSSTAATPDA